MTKLEKYEKRELKFRSDVEKLLIATSVIFRIPVNCKRCPNGEHEHLALKVGNELIVAHPHQPRGARIRRLGDIIDHCWMVPRNWQRHAHKKFNTYGLCAAIIDNAELFGIKHIVIEFTDENKKKIRASITPEKWMRFSMACKDYYGGLRHHEHLRYEPQYYVSIPLLKKWIALGDHTKSVWYEPDFIPKQTSLMDYLLKN